jgi:hypothetical protein
MIISKFAAKGLWVLGQRPMGSRLKTYGFSTADSLSIKYKINKHLISKVLSTIRKDPNIIRIMFSKKSDCAKANTRDTYRGKLYTLSKGIE